MLTAIGLVNGKPWGGALKMREWKMQEWKLQEKTSSRGGNCRSGKYGSENVWKNVRT